MDKETLRLLSEAIERRASRPSSEQFAEMVRRGAIDREGNVLIRRPEEPAFDDGNIADRDVGDQPER